MQYNRRFFTAGICMIFIFFVCFQCVLSNGFVGLEFFNAQDEPFQSVQEALEAMEAVVPNLFEFDEPVCSLLRHELCLVNASLDLCLVIGDAITIKIQDYGGRLEDI